MDWIAGLSGKHLPRTPESKHEKHSLLAVHLHLLPLRFEERKRKTGNEQMQGKVPAGLSGPDVADVERCSTGTSVWLSWGDWLWEGGCYRLNTARSVGAFNFHHHMLWQTPKACSLPRTSPGSWYVYKNPLVSSRLQQVLEILTLVEPV